MMEMSEQDEQLHVESHESSTQMITVTLTPHGEFNLEQQEQPEPMPYSSAHQPGPNQQYIIPDESMRTDPVLPQIPFSFPGQTFDTKCQKLILNVWDFFKRVKKNPDIMEEIRTPQERAAAALHISAATIGKIGKNFKKTGKLETPGAQRKRQRPVVDSISSEDEEVIREIIMEMRNQKITPTLPSVLAEARQRLNFNGGATSFRRILARMGFKNLSQKGNPVKSSPSMSGNETLSTNTMSFSTMKVIKKEPVENSPTNLISIDQGQNSNTNTLSRLQTGNIIQIPTGQILAQTEGGGTTLINGGQGLQPGHTIYIQGADNTIRPVQLIFTPANLT